MDVVPTSKAVDTMYFVWLYTKQHHVAMLSLLKSKGFDANSSSTVLMILSIPLMNQNNVNMKLFNVLCETQEHNVFTAHDLAAWIGCMEATRLSILHYKKMSRCTNHIDMSDNGNNNPNLL